MSIANPILTLETVRTIFTPALTEKASQSLSSFLMARDMQWGTALAITTKDWPNRRRKGTAFCMTQFRPPLNHTAHITPFAIQGQVGQERSISWIRQQVLLLFLVHKSPQQMPLILKSSNCLETSRNWCTVGLSRLASCDMYSTACSRDYLNNVAIQGSYLCLLFVSF